MPARTIADSLEYLQVASLPSVELLQKSFPDQQQLMTNISTLLDPRYVFLIYAPLLFALNKRVGHRLVAALSLAEWANQILKWLLAGERPYWYAQERAHLVQTLNQTFQAPAGLHLLLPEEQPVELRQFPVTCELGAGSPSGHAMVTATVWYLLVDAYLRGELLPANAAPRRLLARAGWALYGALLVAVSLSRVYLACHFPHQCLCGALLGALAARLVIRWLPERHLRRRHFALATGLMFLTVMATYALLGALGRDPLWSVAKGMRWCARREYIHLDTAPFASMTRYLGFCLGAGLAYEPAELVAKAATTKTGAPTLARRLITFALAYLLGQLLLLGPRHAHPTLLYPISFLTYTLFAWAIAGPIPRLTRRALAGRPADGKKAR